MWNARQACCWSHPATALCLMIATLTMGSGAALGQGAERIQRRSFVLQNADPEDVAPQVREALSELPGQSDVFADVSKNRVLVSGNREALAAAASLIEELDVAEELEQEPAEKPFARGYQVDPDALDSTLKSLRELYANHQPAVSINADKRTSKIVVFAQQQVQVVVAYALASASRPQAPARKVKPKTMTLAAPMRRQQMTEEQRLEAVHRFRNLSWQDFEDALSKIWGDHVEVTPDSDNEAADVKLTTRDGTHFLRIDRARNQLEVTQAEPAAKWKQFARVLDGLETKPGQEAQVMTVAHAKPTNVKEVVGAIQHSADLRGKAPLAAQALRRDPKTAKWGGDLVSRVFQQEPAKQPPTETDPAQPPAEEQDPLDGFGNIGPVQIEYIEGLDLLLLIGDPEDVAKVKKLIELLDQQPNIEPHVEIVPLVNTNNEVMAPMLQQVNDQVLVNRQGRVTIIPLGKPNSIMLIGQKESIEVLVRYIEKLDVAIDPTEGFKVIRLRFIPASDAETAIRNFFSDRPGTGNQQNQGQGAQANNRLGLGTRIRVVSEARSNSLIVQGGAGDLRDVEALIKEIDVEDSPSMAQMRVFKLKSALATDLAPLLQSAITGQASTQGGTQQGNQGGFQGNQGNQGGGGAAGTSTIRAPSLQFVQVLDNGQKKVVESGIPTNVVIEADAGSNSLIVRGPERTLDVIGHLIEQLDGVARVGASIKVFNLLKADAQQVYTNLQTLFGVTQGAGAQTQGSFAPATAEGESPLVRLRFAVDRRSNSLIVAGNPGDLNMIEALLGNIDTPDVRNRRIYVYRLVNNDAEFVATAVQTLVTNQQTILRNQAQTQFLYGQLEFLDTEVFIQPELVTNSVIISATPRKLQEIIRVIQQLDLRQPMVMVQMLIAEVSLQNFDELGAEFGLQDAVLFNRAVPSMNPGFLFNNQQVANSLGQFPDQSDNVGAGGVSAFNLGRTSADRGYGGFVFSASSESVSVLIRALQERQRLEILSRPEVMTVDRIPAQVLVGQNVPLVGATNVNINTTTANVDRRNVGISLLVTPQVNADGQIMIEVDASRSALAPLSEGIPIPTNNGSILQPIINTTQAVSTLSCRSGQTVVMAGLITKRRQKASRGIPGLMEIPILGRLFRFDADSETRTELLMVMTPHIIWDGDDLNWLKQTESERMSWCMADVVEVDGDRGFSPGYGLWGSLNMNRIFPHTQPRGVADCTPPPGPPPFLERLRSDITGCPPDDQEYGSRISNTPGPPSTLENRSNWGPMASPHHLLRHPDEPALEAEEVGPPAPEPTRDLDPLNAPQPKPNSPDEAVDPTPPPPTPNPPNELSVSNSMRNATKTRSASTRRSATKPNDDDQVDAPRPVQSASRRPAASSRYSSPQENLPAKYESPNSRPRQRDIEPAGYSDLSNESARRPRASAPSGARREP